MHQTPDQCLDAPDGQYHEIRCSTGSGLLGSLAPARIWLCCAQIQRDPSGNVAYHGRGGQSERM